MEFPVVAVDDDEEFLKDLAELIGSLEYPYRCYESMRVARDAISKDLRSSSYSLVDADGVVVTESWFICVLDHNFRHGVEVEEAWNGREEEPVGYDLSRWLRKKHPLREMLPIIYLTAVETPDGFVHAQREFPQYMPDVFMSKDDLATDPDLLPELLEYYSWQLGKFEQMIEVYGVERARFFLYGMFYD